TIDEKYAANTHIQELLEKNGLKTPANEALMKTVIARITLEYVDSLNESDSDKIKTKTSQYAEGELLPKIEYVLTQLNAIFEAKSNDDANNPNKKLYAFKDSTDV